MILWHFFHPHISIKDAACQIISLCQLKDPVSQGNKELRETILKQGTLETYVLHLGSCDILRCQKCLQEKRR